MARNTDVIFYRGVPLDNRYLHTIYFSSPIEQKKYFDTKIVGTNVVGMKSVFTGLSYHRIHTNRIRIPISADPVEATSNYMSISSTFGTYYCFIIDVEYINDNCCEVVYEVDVMQTFGIFAVFNPCLIERQHTITDMIGEHIEPENVALGEYVFNNYDTLFDLSDMYIIVAIVDVDSVSGNKYDGIYSGATLYAYGTSNDEISSLNSKLQDYVSKPESILGMYMCPKQFVILAFSDHRIPDTETGQELAEFISKPTETTELDNYRPKNCKLYTYPYNFLHVDNSSGGALALRYEFFSSQLARLVVDTTITQPVSAVLRPSSYKGSGDDLYKTLNTESIQITNFPMCSWNFDGYQTWMAQNSVPIALNTASTIGQMAVASTFSVNPLGALAVGSLATATNLISQNYSASTQADISKGNLNNGCNNSANKKNNFNYANCSITLEYAKRIDDYFDMFGYNLGVIDTPVLNARPYWTYIKTNGCNFKDFKDNNMVYPIETYFSKIREIYDNGITVWTNGNNVGNYNLDNRAGIRGRGVTK